MSLKIVRLSAADKAVIHHIFVNFPLKIHNAQFLSKSVILLWLPEWFYYIVSSRNAVNVFFLKAYDKLP
jgi:hypothetical protein